MTRFISAFIVVASLCPLGTPPQLSEAAAAHPRRIEIVASRFAFEPGSVTLKKGEPVVLELTSKDVAHGIRFREFNVDLKATKGGTGEARFTPDKAGDFIGHCSVFCGAGHGAMTLTLHVIG
jgi:cytochrome c oxidase subunit 2